MKLISGFLFAFLFLAHFSTQAQSISGVLDIDVSTLFLTKQRVSPLDSDFTVFKFRFNRLPQIDGVHSFSLYNRTTGLNDIFINSKNNFHYSTSYLQVDNITPSPWNTRVDSFNPNGTNDFGNALLSGALNLIFN